MIKNQNSLRWRIAQKFEELDRGEISVKEAQEFSNMAGKLINSTKAQLEYYALKKSWDEMPDIEFLEEAPLNEEKNQPHDAE
tara:strand:- start:139 stop:384 length:246 start_codon:yes stop_codon:yes gene_type:complete